MQHDDDTQLQPVAQYWLKKQKVKKLETQLNATPVDKLCQHLHWRQTLYRSFSSQETSAIEMKLFNTICRMVSIRGRLLFSITEFQIYRPSKRNYCQCQLANITSSIHVLRVIGDKPFLPSKAVVCVLCPLMESYIIWPSRRLFSLQRRKNLSFQKPQNPISLLRISSASNERPVSCMPSSLVSSFLEFYIHFSL